MNVNLLRGPLVFLFTATLISGCSTISKTTDTVTGWFGFGKSRAVQPAPLPQITEKRQLPKAWSASASEAGRGAFSPVLDGNALYVAGESGRVARINIQNGNEMWHTDIGKKLSAGVGAGGNLVLVGGL